MTVLEWIGEIGWELWTPELRAQLKASKGDDLIIRFSSVGGSIFEGGDIFNLLADHRRDNPKIKMNLEIKSTALSMGSAIAASPVWDDISVEQTSMFMLHNPWTIAIGDFDEMQSSADFLKSARDMFARIYSAKSKQSVNDTIDAMSTETWYFGQEIIDAGFANRMNESVSSADPQDKVIAFKTASVKFEGMKKRQKILNEGEKFDIERAVACLKSAPKMTVTSFKSNAKLIDRIWDKSASENRWRDHVGVDDNEDLPKAAYTKRFAWFDPEDNQNFGAYKFPHWDFTDADGEHVNIAAVRNGLARVGNSSIPADEKPKVENLLTKYLDKFKKQQETEGKSINKPVQSGKKTEDIMDKAELKKDNPAVYDDTIQDGVKIERDRVKELTAMKARDEYKDIPEVWVVIDKAIDEGQQSGEVQPLIMAVVLKIANDPARAKAAIQESPGDIQCGNEQNTVIKTERIREV